MCWADFFAGMGFGAFLMIIVVLCATRGRF